MSRMRDMIERGQGWLAAAALVGVVPGLIWAPELTWTVLAVYGFAMLVVVAGVAARGLGIAKTIVRGALGASIGPWAALVVGDMPTAAALELALIAALLAIASAHFTSSMRRDGLTVYFGFADRDTPGR